MIKQKDLLDEGIAEHQAGNLVAAKQVYQRILINTPQYSEALHLLGILEFQVGNLADAEKLIQKSIKINPRVAAYFSNLGRILKASGEVSRAIKAYKKALKLNAEDSQVYSDLAAAFIEIKNYHSAKQAVQSALVISPRSSHALLNLGLVQRAIGQTELAFDSFKAAAEGDIPIAEAYFQYGQSLYEKSQFQNAITAYKTAIEIQPNMIEAHCNLGNALRILCFFEEAIDCYNKALKIDSNKAELHANRGVAFQEIGMLDEAVKNYRSALEIDPKDPETHRNLGMALLQNKNFSEGWKEFEWRCKTKNFMNNKDIPKRLRWSEQNPDGKTLLVHAEQGYGDSIHFSRYLTRVNALGAKVIVECPKPLMGLLSLVKGVNAVIEVDDKRPRFDFHIPMMSLPGVFKEDLSNPNLGRPYIKLLKKNIQNWENRLSHFLGKKNVGLVWRGNSDHPRDALRSPGLIAFSSLIDSKDINFFSFQKDGGEIEINKANLSKKIINIGSNFELFIDTAAAISCMDLIITPDTAVAHLCGAIGKEVWLLLSYVSEWRWFDGVNSTPWYNSMRLFRQPTVGDWKGVIDQVNENLYAVSERDF